MRIEETSICSSGVFSCWYVLCRWDAVVDAKVVLGYLSGYGIIEVHCTASPFRQGDTFFVGRGYMIALFPDLFIVVRALTEGYRRPVLWNASL